MSKFPALVTLRWVVAAVFAGFGLYELGRVSVAGLSYGAFTNVLLGLGALFCAVVLVGSEIVGLVVLPLHRLLDRLLMPGESGPPPAAFKLARYYADLSRHEEACEEYAKIIRYHPEETDAYLEGIREAILAGNRTRAKKFLRGGKRFMRAPHERALLERVYSAHHEPAAPLEEIGTTEAEPDGGMLTG